MSVVKTWIVIGLAAAVFLAAPGFAADRARVVGSVIDRQGAPVDDVEVTVRDRQSGVESTARTNSKGKFKLEVEDATQPQAIRLRKQGFRTSEVDLEVEPGATLEATWTLLREEEAVAVAAEIAEIEGKNRAAKIYNEAAKLYNEGDGDAAVAKFEEALAEDAALGIAWAGLARIYLEREQYEKALEAATALRQLAPEETLAMQLEYDSLWGLGRREQAGETLELLIAAEPGRAAAARLFNRGVAAVESHDLDSALAYFARAVTIDPSLHQALLTQGQIHEARGEAEAALEKVEAYHAVAEPTLRSRMVKYSSLAALGRTSEAEATLAELAPDEAVLAAESFLKEGAQHFDDGRSDQALAAFKTALALDPNRARTHYRLGLSWASLGENGKARAALEKFLELAPDDPEAAAAREMLGYLGN